MTKTKKIIILTSVIASILLILILGTIFDLQISKALADLSGGEYYSSNIFAIIGECIGEDVLYLLVITACAILFFYFLKFPLQKKWQNYLCWAIAIFISYLASVYLFYVTLDNFVPYVMGVGDYIHSSIGIATIFIFPIFIASVIFLLVSKMKPETIKQLWKWALLILIVAFISNSIVQIAKVTFDRTRFRAMIFSNDTDFSYYTNWFTINTKKFDNFFGDDFFKSFPSGHTCAATSTFVLALLPFYIQKLNNKRNKIILWIVPSIYTFLIALSRIIAGAHFFTDVYIAFLITIATIIVTYIVIEMVSKKLGNKFATSSINSNNQVEFNKEKEISSSNIKDSKEKDETKENLTTKTNNATKNKSKTTKEK